MIRIERLSEQTWRVTVENRTTTTHEVSVADEYYRKLTGGKVTVEHLLEMSFEFLLARESNTSILRRFDLSVIENYFPEYESSIAKAL